MLRFFFKADDAVSRIDCRDAKASCLFGRNLNRCNGDVGSLLTMPASHLPVIHFVDMVGGEYQYMIGIFGFNGFDILINRIGRA